MAETSGAATTGTSILDRLKEGVRRFQSEVYPSRREAYQRAESEPQRPHTLLITCADSRIDPEAVTQAGPGEVFVSRNIGNMVPPYGEMRGGVSAVIEYAVAALGVEHIVVCGHSDCGAMKALLHPESTDKMPTVRNWLNNGQAALSVAQTLEPDAGGIGPLRSLTEQNVLMQMQHLKTHPSVAGGIAGGGLTISGWVYEIGAGEVRIAEDGERHFTPISRWAAATELAGHPVR